MLDYSITPHTQPAAYTSNIHVQPAEEASSSESTDTHHILLVEDNIVNQTVVKRMLAKEGYTVEVASNGEEAVYKVSNGGNFDLIFMDCQMPRMDGYEASRHIRDIEQSHQVAPRIPIVALTANAMQGDRERCIEAGMDDYIAKPVKKEAILEVLRRHLL